MKIEIRKYLTYGSLYIGILFLLIAIFFYMLNYDIAFTHGFFWSLLSFGLILCFAGVVDWYNYFYKPQKETEIKKQKSDKINEESLKILKTRYAKGEITKEEYKKMKKDLE